GARDSLLVDDRLRLLPVMAWALRSTTLDLAELSTRAGGESAEALRALAADHETCMGAACDMRRGCALSRLRLRAAASDLLIINHALWFAGSAVGTIPEVHRVVFDEAHTLEDVATDHYTLELSADALERIMLRVHNPADGDGVIAATESLLEAAIPPPQDALALARSAREMAQQILSSCSALGRLCEALADKLDPGGRAGRSRLRPEVTRLLPYQHLAEFTEDTCVELRSLAEILDQLAGLLGDLEDSPMGELELLAIATGELRSQSAELQGYAEAAEEVIALSDPDRVFFLERSRSEAVVRAAPVEVGRDLARQVFEPRPTVILTSATLSVGGDMSYFQDRLGLGQVSERLISASYPSEFDYSTQTCFCVPTDVPDPREDGWLDAVGEAIVELVQATRGRALVLFTSRAHLEAVYESRRRDIEALGIPTYSQLANLSRAHVRRAFSQDVSSVLFATRSFFEGVDIPGESLSSVVLTRLPFAVPTDPIVEARREKVAERGHDPMEAYYIPQAVITFRQAFGRLIRRKTDRGSVIVLDPRIVRKRYGKRFMESVPECRVVQKPLGAVADFLSRFFDEG
ncbi:MAG: hypothetical protein GF320_10495, partial [Armatimonadia bacterium]|nr:hypothetical protein [Armatimonadia bacterium]